MLKQFKDEDTDFDEDLYWEINKNNYVEFSYEKELLFSLGLTLCHIYNDVLNKAPEYLNFAIKCLNFSSDFKEYTIDQAKADYTQLLNIKIKLEQQGGSVKWIRTNIPPIKYKGKTACIYQSVSKRNKINFVKKLNKDTGKFDYKKVKL